MSEHLGAHLGVHADATQAWVSCAKDTLAHGKPSSPRGLPTLEVLGRSVTLGDVRQRVLLSPARRLNPFFLVAEGLWLLRGSRRVDEISHYLRAMKQFSDDGEVLHGAYGARLLGLHPPGSVNQLEAAVSLLREDKESRRVVLRIFDPGLDLVESRDIPCTCQIQLLIRNGALEGFSYMRSQDVFLGLPYDLAWIGLVIEYMAVRLEVNPGGLHHTMASLHVYEEHLPIVRDLADHLSDVGEPTGPATAMTKNTIKELPKLYDLERRLRLRQMDPKSALHEAQGFSTFSRQVLAVLSSHVLWRTGDVATAIQVAQEEGGALGSLAGEFIEEGPIRARPPGK